MNGLKVEVITKSSIQEPIKGAQIVRHADWLSSRVCKCNGKKEEAF
jgi:hypothetical protein